MDRRAAPLAVVFALAVALSGCASSSTTNAPSLPQPPSPPSLPTPPSPPAPTPPTPSKPETGSDARGEKGETGAASGSAARTGGGAKTPEERREALDGQLQTSMAEFDAMLVKEQQALEAKQRANPLPDRSGESAGGAGAPGGESGEGGGAAGGAKDDRTPAERRADAEAEAAAKQTGGAPPADTGTGGSPDAGRLEGGAPVTAPVEGGPAGAGGDDAAVPADVGDGKDDDVVARQLREAATQEKDPAIREKLWDEYREYKKSAGKGGS